MHEMHDYATRDASSTATTKPYFHAVVFFSMPTANHTMIPRIFLSSFLVFLLCSTTEASSQKWQSVGSYQSSIIEPESPAPCTGEPAVPNHRRACNFYVWDFPSALLYKWCHHLLKDHIYEGRGGRMFIRYESNSILQLLYPCSRYSPNRCLVCGGNFPDHLELWWSQHLYTPFDLHLDRTYESGIKLPDVQKKHRRQTPSKRSAPEITGPPTFDFHRRYVHDVSHLFREITGKKKQLDVVKQKMIKESKYGLDRLRLTRFPQYGIAYLTPQLLLESGKKASLTLRFAISLCLNSLENLVILQENENARLRNNC